MYNQDFHVEAYEELKKGSETSKAKFLDWRFQLRFSRRKNSNRMRYWYPDEITWVENGDPSNMSPLQFITKVIKINFH